MQQRERDFQERIRRFHSSNYKNFLQKSVFSKIQTLKRCHCCQESSDYPLLSSIRQNKNNKNQQKGQEEEKEQEEPEEKEEEDEDDDDLDDDYISPIEIIRKEKYKTQLLKYENLQSLGFLLHLHESSSHLLTAIKDGISVPIVLHICYPENLISASIDLNFEILSFKYCGTLFRRIYVEECHPILSYFNLIPPVSPLILSIDSHGSLLDVCSDFDSFHAGIILVSFTD